MKFQDWRGGVGGKGIKCFSPGRISVLRGLFLSGDQYPIAWHGFEHFT